MGNSTNYTVNIKALFDAGDALSKIKNIQTVLNNLKLPDNLRTSLDSNFRSLDKALQDFQSKSEKGVKSRADATGITKSFDTVVREFENIDKIVTKIKTEMGDSIDLSNFINVDPSVKKKLEDIGKEITDLQNQLNNVNTSKLKEIENVLGKLKTEKSKEKIGDALNIFKNAKDVKDIEKAVQLIEQAKKSYNGLLTTENKKGLGENGTAHQIVATYEEIIGILGKAKTEVQDFQDQINQKQGEGLKTAADEAERLSTNANGAVNGLHSYASAAKDARSGVEELTDAQRDFNSQVDQVKHRIQYFFGLANSINLVKRAVRSAFETVKELDKAMTETAVVTNYTIKDMWKQLPEYTKRANSLGVTTKEAYESATLYYQQGLNTEQAAALSTETLKMARIAGLDAADATDRMTNALRGFNMELNATQAQRVDDVYSQLAAMSASNVDEISTAMTKVASLAHNANMEFETTAAFLAQIIETTRESAETAGTALKTVVARFSEVKKLYDTDQLKGQDEEGQVIDVNKVSAALRSAGIDLNKYFLGEVGLDDIFMELASKWDSLTNIQQRYIATQAAGSRQQSRFIALMADYARTQELVSAAYSSNGAAEKQFEKTQDSMQSKLARLKNAWNEFTMGLANNALLKAAVDGLTQLLNIINKITSALGGGVGSFAKWFVAIKTISGLGKAFRHGGIADKALTKVLGGTIFSRLLGAQPKAAEGGQQAQTGTEAQGAQGGTQTRVFGTGGILRSIFSGDLKKNIQAFKEKYPNMRPLTAEEVYSSGMAIDSEYADSLIDAEMMATKTSLFSALGNAFKGTKVGGAISKIPTLWGAGALSGAATLATTLGGIAATVAAIYAGYKIWQNTSLEGQLQQANKLAKSMSVVADNTQRANTEVKKVQSEYGEKNAAVESALTQEERQAAVRERTDYVAELIKSNEKYADYLISTFENGELVLKLDESSINALATATAEAEKKASSASDFTAATAAGKEAAVYEAKAKEIREFGPNGGYYKKPEELDEKEYQEYLAYQKQANSARLREKAYAKAAYANLINTTGLTDAAADAVASALAEGFSSDKFLSQTKKKQRADWWSGNATKEQLRATYKTLYGTDAGDLDKDALADAVATAEVIQGSYEKIASSITKITSKEGGLKLLEVIAGTYAGSLENIGTELSDAFDSLDKETAKNLLEALNLSSSKDLATFLGEAIDGIINNRKELQKNAVKSLMKTGVKETKTLKDFTKLEAEQQKKVLQIGENLADYGVDFRQKVLGAMVDAVQPGAENKDIQNFIDSFSNNIILTYQSIQKEIKNTSSEASAFAEELKKTGEESGIFSNENLVQFYLTSGEFESLTEQVDKFIEENGKITADNINELAKSSQSLAALIDMGTMKATGMARAIQAFSAGNIAISDLNDNVLEVFNSFENLNDIIAKASYFIKNFDAGEDWGESFDFIESAIETIEGFVNSREFGNPQLQNYWGAIFKTSPSDLDGWNKGIEVLKELQEWGGGRFWTNVMGTTLDEETGIMTNMGVGNLTSSQYRDLMRQRANEFTRARGIADFTDDYLNMQFQNMANHDYGVVKQLAANDVRAIAESYKQAYGEEVPTKADIQAIADGFGITPQAVLDAYNELYKQTLSLDQLKENVKKTGEVLDKAVKESFEEVQKEKGGKKGGELLSELGIDSTTGEFDIGTLKANITDIVPEIQNGSISAEEWINQYIGSQGGKVQVPVEFKVLKDNGDGTFGYETIEKTLEITNLGELQNGVDQLTNEFNNLNASALVGSIDGANEAANNLQSILENLKITLDSSALQSALTTAENINSTLSATINKTVNITKVYTGDKGNSSSSGYSSTNAEMGEAAGGYVSYASGSRKIKPGIALTGEEGPELVWNKEGGYAYLTGKNGPEFRKLVAGDQIFPSDQTKAILARGVTPSLAKGGKVVPSLADGDTIWTNDKDKGKGSGSGDKKKDDEFKMDLDKYYNMVEDINELLRLRNLLETNYNQLLKIEGKTGKEIYDNLTKQLDLLQQRYQITEDLAEKRKQQIIDLVAENEELSKYAWWNNEDLTIEINWDLVNGITDKDEGSKVKDYLSKLEDFQSKYDDMIENLEDIESTIQEIKERGKDEYKSLEDRTRDALIKQIQDKIDELTDVDKAITDTNQKLFDSMQETLSMQRQQRDNAETESELTDKEKRLAYLQQDSSNANQVEIAKLQKEIDDARQDYTDNLIDQKISELQRQNDEAQEQRQQQIELMQRSLDWQEKDGQFWNEAYRLISEGTDATGALIHKSDLENVLKGSEGWAGLSDEGKMDWLKTLEDQVAQGIAYLEQSRQLEDLGTKEGTQISFTNAKGERLTGTVDKDGNVVVKNKDGSTITYKDVFQDYYGNYRTFEGSGETKAAPKPATSTGTGGKTTGSTTTTTGGSDSNKKVTASNNGEIEFQYEAEDEFDHWVYYRQKGTTKWKNKGLEGHNFVNGQCSKCHYIKQVNTKGKSLDFLEKQLEAASTSKFNEDTQNKTNGSVTRPVGRTNKKIGEGTASIPKVKHEDSTTQERMTDKELNDLIDSNIDEFNNLVYPTTTKVTGTHGKKVGTGTASVPTSKSSNNNTSNITKKEEEKKKWTLLDALKATGMFASGGLADFTGPAWLDGTRSHPELVLNSRDTQNFIELKDTLADMRKNGSLSLAGGDSYYEIVVNVDQMSSDYDVDKAIDRIKARLAQDGAYRNVNALSRLR